MADHRVAQVHRQYVADLQAHHVHQPRVYGNMDAPLPPLPPFTPHSNRLFLVWSSIVVALFGALPLAWSVLSDLRKLWRSRHGRLKVPVTPVMRQQYRDVTGETDDVVVTTALRATAAFSEDQSVDVDLAVARFHYRLELLAGATDAQPLSVDDDELAAQANANLNASVHVDKLALVGKVCLALAAVGYVVLAVTEVLSSNAWAVLGVPQSASIDDVKRAYRRQAALLHPDAAERALSAGAQERLNVLQTARDEILNGLGLPLAVALPEMSETTALLFYAAFIIAAGTAIVVLTCCCVSSGPAAPPRGHRVDGSLDHRDFVQKED